MIDIEVRVNGQTIKLDVDKVTLDSHNYYYGVDASTRPNVALIYVFDANYNLIGVATVDHNVEQIIGVTNDGEEFTINYFDIEFDSDDARKYIATQVMLCACY